MLPGPRLPLGNARLALVAALVVASAGLMACQATETTRDVTDSASLFHFKIPASWQYRVEPGVLSVYADDTLPEPGQEIEALAIVTFVSGATTDTPVPEALVAYAEYWGDTRGWTDVEIGETSAQEVGGRTGSRVEIAGIDGSGRAFRASYVWVRTNNREVLVTAVAPPERWDAYAADLDTVLEQWFWHREEGTSADETATP